MSSFLVAGSIAYDMLLSYDGSFADGIDTENLDKLSVAYVTRHLARHHGGTAANIAWNLALLGQEAIISGSVGHDGAEYLKRLKKKKIDISHVKTYKDHVTPIAIIGTDSAERQITFFHPGADLLTTPPDMKVLSGKVTYTLVSPHSVTSMQQTVLACQEHKVPYVFDPGQMILQFSHDELRRMVEGSMAVFVNSYEWSLLQEALGWNDRDVLAHSGLLIITHGEHGLGIQTAEESIVVEAVPAEKLVNPTGAGDALRAGFVTGLAHGFSPRDAGRLGAALASFVVESEGTQLEEFSLSAMYARAEKKYGEKLPALG